MCVHTMTQSAKLSMYVCMYVLPGLRVGSGGGGGVAVGNKIGQIISGLQHTGHH